MYEPPVGVALQLAHETLLLDINRDIDIVLDFGGTAVAWLPTPCVGNRKSVGWKSLQGTPGGTKSVAAPWTKYLLRDRNAIIHSNQAERVVQYQCCLPWGTTGQVDRRNRVSWMAALPENGYRVQTNWSALTKEDVSLSGIWGDAASIDSACVFPWINTLVKGDFASHFLWGSTKEINNRVVNPWRNTTPVKDLLHRVYWGKELYERICLREYTAPVGWDLDFILDTPLTQTDDKTHIRLRFDQMSYDLRCNQQEPSGWRDNYIRVPVATWPITPTLLVYYVMNSATLIRTSDNTEIPVLGMSVKADIDSWCWRFSATIPEAALPLVTPESGPVEVMATINGYSWLIMIESWKESVSFNSHKFDVSGRSTSAELAAPYAPAVSGVYEDTITSIQITEDQLLNTGWTIGWGDIPGWLVDGGAFSYQNWTALKVVQAVAEAAGGRIQTARNAAELEVVRRLHSLPWTWSSATPDLSISDYVTKQLTRSFVPGVAYNAVFVSGQNQGVLAKVYRQGTAGDEVARMVTDALITDVEPARERGRMVIGRSGSWSKEALTLPLTAPADLPGLLEIGMLISMSEGSQIWRGQVAGVGVSARWDIREGLKVDQVIDVERYRGT
ncbi:MAG: hypothetical protein CSA20_08525 [Deltaproteobacteria bacterium]|nr:MAG: hypothetical protein CSA20_08525 [Deltaproteobacteria bacterium]